MFDAEHGDEYKHRDELTSRFFSYPTTTRKLTLQPVLQCELLVRVW